MAEDENGQGPESTEDAGTQEEQNAGGTESPEDSNSQDGNEESNEDQTISKAEYDKLFNRMQAADRAKSEAEKKLKDIEEADMSEHEKTKSQLETVTKERDDLANKMKQTLLENAFHRDNKFTWHDPADAIAALDMSGVEITDEGKVTGMEAAIKDVAKRKPHYVKKEEDPPPAANGANNGQRKGEKKDAPDRQGLVARFPALGK